MASFDINASPTKRFFVGMLTRDIELGDAILDLLDNTVDGVLRVIGARKSKADKPYDGFHADLKFSKGSFKISDNCGGIPPDVAKDYAFRMGRLPTDHRDANLPTVGMYGIGMKRALFKMGSAVVVESHHDKGSFRVEITPAWLKSNDEWSIPAKEFKDKSSDRGTTITVTNLLPAIAAQFSSDSDFEATLIERLQTHYAFIIDKGFRVTVNGKIVAPRPIQFLFQEPQRGKPGIAPYVYEHEKDGVHVLIVVGFYRPMADLDEEDENKIAKHSKETAGWTVICNDRVVLYCDKTRNTGWGEATVPMFHPQFNSIGGIVELKSNDPNLLPLTTTKRGIDGNSDLYLALKNYMREGTKIFTDYTNRWKKAKDQARTNEKAAKSTPVSEVKAKLANSDFKAVKIGGKRFVPDLPTPKAESDDVVVRFTKSKRQVARLGRVLLEDPHARPGLVGEKAFDFALKEAK